MPTQSTTNCDYLVDYLSSLDASGMVKIAGLLDGMINKSNTSPHAFSGAKNMANNGINEGVIAYIIRKGGSSVFRIRDKLDRIRLVRDIIYWRLRANATEPEKNKSVRNQIWQSLLSGTPPQ